MSIPKISEPITYELLEDTDTQGAMEMVYWRTNKKIIEKLTDEEQWELTRRFFAAKSPEEAEKLMPLTPQEILAMEQ